MQFPRRIKAQSAIEYMVMIIFIGTAFLLMQKYIARSVAGRWQGVGEIISGGRQFEPNVTTECVWDGKYFEVWYDINRFETNPRGYDCYEVCYAYPQTQEMQNDCQRCICMSSNEQCGEFSEGVALECISLLTPI